MVEIENLGRTNCRRLSIIRLRYGYLGFEPSNDQRALYIFNTLDVYLIVATIQHLLYLEKVFFGTHVIREKYLFCLQKYTLKILSVNFVTPRIQVII